MKAMKKILFITGTRADYGKMKALIRRVDTSDDFQAFIYVSGMHLMEVLGNTYEEILKDHYSNVHVAYGLANTRMASYDLGDVICNLTGYVLKISPDLLVVHGDRIDALAGAVVGALNNIKVAHIEGGEVSGTIDESIRHAISKFAHIHLVCNEEAEKRLIQLGEERENIHIIGSPDVDIMISEQLPTITQAKARYEIPFDNYAILMYHPVTTEYVHLSQNIKELVNSVIASNKNYIVVYPNNDLGYELILNEYKRLEHNPRFKIFPSLRFEYFLTLLQNAEFMLGNSSAGIRESCIYGVPSIDVGSRQSGRYAQPNRTNIQHVCENEKEIVSAIGRIKDYRFESSHFGDGKSAEHFMDLLRSPEIWDMKLQKQFVDYNG